MYLIYWENKVGFRTNLYAEVYTDININTFDQGRKFK